MSEFIKSSRDGNKAFIVQSGFNRYGRYLESGVVEYTMDGHRGLIVISKERERWGRRSFSAELRKVVAFLDFSLGTGRSILEVLGRTMQLEGCPLVLVVKVE